MSAINRTCRSLTEVNLFLSQPRRILDSLLNVFLFQVGISLQELVKRRPMCDLTTITETGMRIPRMHARPRVIWGQK
jgi:hypothetical protein